MTLTLVETGTLYANPDPLLVSRQAVFPGLTRLADGDIVALFSIGQAFDAADTRAYVSRSADNGRTWSAPSRLCETEHSPEESESFKPLALADGTVLATGYVFERPTPLTPIVDPQTNALLPLHNKLSRSTDGGRTWSEPQHFSVEGAPLELSGPCIQLPSGRILGSAAPFHLTPTGHEGWIIASDDGGASWSRQSVFFRSESGSIAPWETRLIDFGDNRIGVLFWAFDLAEEKSRTNRLAFSEDDAHTFKVIDTGIAAQASGGVAISHNELLSIHAHRESPVGLVVRRSQLGVSGLEVTDTLSLFASETMAARSGDAGDTFASLRFGQPSLLPLGDEEYLACCWQVENGQHVIKTFRITL